MPWKMYLLAKFGGHKSYRNGYVNLYINYYMDTLEKAELTASICHIARFLKLGILIYNSEGYGWLKNEKKKKNTGNYKALCVLQYFQ